MAWIPVRGALNNSSRTTIKCVRDAAASPLDKRRHNTHSFLLNWAQLQLKYRNDADQEHDAIAQGTRSALNDIRAP